MAASQSQPTPAKHGRVYLEFYGLTEPPFAITPDPEFLYLSPTHQAAVEKLQYGITARLGFMLLTGEVGTGKTTLCRYLLDLLQGQAETVYIVNPSLTGKELVATILDDLGLTYPQKATKKALIDLLTNFLLTRDNSRPVVLIIDDAQAMATEALENLRLLSNLETDKIKLLQILLVGQPELDERINQTQLRQLRQRISLHCRLDLLGLKETEEYISRRLYASGNKGSLRFTPQGINLVQKCSGGIPRLINKICDYALVAGYVANEHSIGPAHIKRAVQETGTMGPRTYGPNHGAQILLGPRLLAALALGGILVLAVWLNLS